MATGSSPRRSAFAPMYLVAAYALVTVLLALLVPMYLRKTEAATKGTCASNLRRIGAALRLYEADHDGWLPPDFCDSVRGNAADPLLPYTKTGAIYTCPNEPSLSRSYLYRISALAGPGPSAGPAYHGPGRAMLPAPSSVVVYCGSHVSRELSPAAAGDYLVLRHNGSVAPVPAASVVVWGYRKGVWTRDWHEPDTSIWVVFPNEPWPPTFR